MSNALTIKPNAHAEVIETEFSMLLMSNYYKKEDLTPVSLIGGLPDVSIGNNMLNISAHMNLGTTARQGFRHKVMGIVKDPYLDDIYYFSINGGHSNYTSNSIGAFCMAYEKNDDIKIITTIQIHNIEFIEIFDIDENFIYVSAQSLAEATQYVYKINKTTYSASVIYTVSLSSRTKIQLICKDETYLYFLSRTSYGTFYISQYNKSSSSIINKSITPTQDTALQYNHIEFMDFYCQNGNYFFCIPKANGNTGDVNFIGYKFNSNISFDSDSVIENIGIDVKNNANLTWAAFTGYVNYRFWIKDGFLFYAVYDEDYSNNVSTAIPIQGIHKFKIQLDFNLTYVSTLKVNKDKKIISMIFNSDKSYIVVGYNLSIDFLKYNPTTNEYENTNKEIPNIQSAGFDSLDRLWYMNSNYGVYVHNLDDPQEVIMEFESQYYSYRGFDIETYLLFKATSFINTAPVGKYKITLEGNAYFKATGTNVIEFDYTGGEIKYDIIIDGRNRLSCSAEFIKVW